MAATAVCQFQNDPNPPADKITYDFDYNTNGSKQLYFWQAYQEITYLNTQGNVIGNLTLGAGSGNIPSQSIAGYKGSFEWDGYNNAVAHEPNGTSQVSWYYHLSVLGHNGSLQVDTIANQ